MQMVGSIFVTFPLAAVVDQPWQLPMPSLAALGAIVGMGVLGSTLAPLCHFTVLQRAGATNASLVTLIMPLTPIVLGAVFLGDRLTPRDMLGALVIAAALIIIDGRVVSALRRDHAQVLVSIRAHFRSIAPHAGEKETRLTPPRGAARLCAPA